MVSVAFTCMPTDEVHMDDRLSMSIGEGGRDGVGGLEGRCTWAQRDLQLLRYGSAQPGASKSTQRMPRLSVCRRTENRTSAAI